MITLCILTIMYKKKATTEITKKKNQTKHSNSCKRCQKKLIINLKMQKFIGKCNILILYVFLSSLCKMTIDFPSGTCT